MFVSSRGSLKHQEKANAVFSALKLVGEKLGEATTVQVPIIFIMLKRVHAWGMVRGCCVYKNKQIMNDGSNVACQPWEMYHIYAPEMKLGAFLTSVVPFYSVNSTVP